MKPNDRLPVLPEVHEKVCKKNCVKKVHLKRTTRNTQRTQSVVCGYFGGYVGKRQPAGALETKKCVDKLFTLRGKIAGHSKAQQVRSVSQRLITDLEMNSTYRGAVEVFNLCRHLKTGDVLFAECIRTFGSRVVDGRGWMYRLEASQLDSKFTSESVQKYIPVTRKPNVRTDRSVANDMDIYGLRPLRHPWVLLSPYEFLRYWRAEPLLAPSYYFATDKTPRTRWTPDGEKVMRSEAYKDGTVTLKPGLHYVIIEPDANADYIAFPVEPVHIYNVFRHTWVLVRKKRPDVVVIEGLKMPRASRAAKENAKYCCLFFRPWTLLSGDPRIPNLALLGLPHERLLDVYATSHTRSAAGHDQSRLLDVYATSDTRSAAGHDQSLCNVVAWERTWDAYVRGNVVSDAAAMLIRSFLLKTIAATGATMEEEKSSDEEDEPHDPEIPTVKLDASQFQQLLSPCRDVSESQDESRELKKTGKKLQRHQRKKFFEEEYRKSIEIARAVWSTDSQHREPRERRNPGHMYAEEYEEHLKAKTKQRCMSGVSKAPFDEERNAAASWNKPGASASLDAAFKDICAEKEPPNQEQRAFLIHFLRRLKLEVLEQQLQRVNESVEEPLLDVVHGFPGTGKSHLIHWMRVLMEQGLGWQHGIQFVCLAFQNAMAAQINGFTIHHWSGIPVRSTDGNNTGDRHQQSIKCQALRVMILDELSMNSAELLGALNFVTSKAIRVNGTYKKRKDGTSRVFGGVNVVMCVDFWQLKPVTGTWLCDNPLDIPAGRARDALEILWDTGPDSIRHFWSLTQMMRCKDPW